MDTAEKLVKDAEDVLEQGVLAPIILQKCAARGYEPKNDEEVAAVLKIASEIREKVAAGEIAPVPASELDKEGKLTKEASEKIEQDPLAFADDIQVDLDQVDPKVKEAAAVAVWNTLEQVKAAQEKEAEKPGEKTE